MKFPRNEKYASIAVYTFLVLGALLVLSQFLQNISFLSGWVQGTLQLLAPIFYGFVIAFLLNPLLRWFDDKLLCRIFKKWKKQPKPVTRRGIALGLTYLTTFVVLSVFIGLVLPELRVVTQIGSNVSYYIHSVEKLYTRFNEWVSGLQLISADGNTQVLLQTLSERLAELTEGLVESIVQYLTYGVSAIFAATTRLTAGILNGVLGVIVSIYFLMDREKLFAQLKKIIRAIFPQKISNLLYEIALDCHHIFNGYIVGSVTDSLIVGILCFIFSSILQIPSALLISTIVGITNIIPYFGPFIGVIPGFLIVFAQNPTAALWFVIMILVLQQIDGNIIAPKILGDSTGLSPLWIIFAITLFSGILGIAGMFLGVPLFAILYSLIRRLVNFLLRRKGESIKTRDYDSAKNPLIK
ncbi:AI-2E family transporter [Oscillospiraceae bacterium MB08-C2-2]|nr:AI-2E family transporter [Oscillospiraceae bacterium MB08-C2-2]